MKIIDTVKDKIKRHNERHTALGYQYIFSDSIAFINKTDWDSVAQRSSVFLSRKYLQAIEISSPENTSQRYGIAYCDGVAVMIVACQVAEISGETLFQENQGVKSRIASNYQERVLVCGNLVSSGLHGVGFSADIDKETGWKIVAEILYKIRQSEKLAGKIDFVMVKDIKLPELQASTIVERFSYRRIQTDPDMALDLGNVISSFDDYLQSLTSKYRGRINKIIKTLDQAGFSCEKIAIDEATDKELHQLYLQVEKKSATRLATLVEGYFLELYNNLGENFSCHVIKRDNVFAGFVTVIKDREDAVAYYVGVDYEVNSKYPIYFRLLQLVIEIGIEMGCKKILFGRTALEPKASLGAKPVDTFIWARHRVPVVNFVVRKLFRNMPFDTAPERRVTKK